MKIFVLKDGLRYGPYSVEELREQLETGMFNPKHFASVDDGHNWIPIDQVSVIAPRRFAVEVDHERNLLLISYQGRVGQKDVQQCAAEIRRALPGLKRDFQLLVDFTELKEMDVSCASSVAEIMDLCNEAGVATVVRVIPDGQRDIGLQIMSLFHYGNDVCLSTCTSLDEAWALLAPDEHEKPKTIEAIAQ